MNPPTVVCGNGSYSTKIGFAGNNNPHVTFCSVVGHPKDPKRIGEGYIGREAQERRRFLRLKHPTENGIVTNWDDMEALWHHALCNELRVTPSDVGILHSECPMNHKVNREKMTQIMFETFNVHHMNAHADAALALYSTGRTTGVVVDVGHAAAHVVPVYDGYFLPHAMQRWCSMGSGDSSIQYMRGTLNLSDALVAEDMKINLGFVALDYDDCISKGVVPPVNYALPDGNTISVRNEQITCTEIFFRPTLLGLSSGGLHWNVFHSITHCDIDIRQDLYSNVLLTGGSMLFKGMADRIAKELKYLAPSALSSKISVHVDPSGVNGAWVGGSIYGTLSEFLTVCVTRAEYDEEGPTMVHRKCFF